MTQRHPAQGYDFELVFAALRPLSETESADVYAARLEAELRKTSGLPQMRVSMRAVQVQVGDGMVSEPYRCLRVLGSTPRDSDASAKLDDLVAAVRWATGNIVVLLRSTLVIRVARRDPAPPPGCRLVRPDAQPRRYS